MNANVSERIASGLQILDRVVREPEVELRVFDNTAIGHHSPSDGRLRFNLAHPSWHDPAYFWRLRNDAIMSSADPCHAVHHEVGHLEHFRRNGLAFITMRRETLDPGEQEIARRVSWHACQNQIEFVAEVFAAMAAGRSLDAEVMAMYRELRGPELR